MVDEAHNLRAGRYTLFRVGAYAIRVIATAGCNGPATSALAATLGDYTRHRRQEAPVSHPI